MRMYNAPRRLCAACVDYGIIGNLPPDTELGNPKPLHEFFELKLTAELSVSMRLGRGAITGKCKQPPVVSSRWELKT